jgi:hypothetical protein
MGTPAELQIQLRQPSRQEWVVSIAWALGAVSEAAVAARERARNNIFLRINTS